MRFLREHDLTYQGDFPINTHGGQLSFGQSAAAGGMSQIIEAFHQISERAGDDNLADAITCLLLGPAGS